MLCHFCRVVEFCSIDVVVSFSGFSCGLAVISDGLASLKVKLYNYSFCIKNILYTRAYHTCTPLVKCDDQMYLPI